MESGNIKIEWIQKSGKQCLKFTFGERLTEKEAEGTIIEWRKAFQSKLDESIVLIWDCRTMTSYESVARVNWQNALKEMKSQIDSIWLITNSGMVKMGAIVMGAFSSFDIKTIGSESEIII